VVAMTHSMEGDTSMNFTLADDIMVMVQTSSGGVEELGGPRVGMPVRIRPNPCGRLATVECAPDRPGRAEVTVRDGLGRALLTREYSAGKATNIRLDLGDLPAGVYFCTLTAAGQTATRQLVRLQ